MPATIEDRKRIAAELLKHHEADPYASEHKLIAGMLLDEDVKIEVILADDILDNIPETYSWLRGELADYRYDIRHFTFSGYVMAESPEAAAEKWISQWGVKPDSEDGGPFLEAEQKQSVAVIDSTGHETTFEFAVNVFGEYRRVEPKTSNVNEINGDSAIGA